MHIKRSPLLICTPISRLLCQPLCSLGSHFVFLYPNIHIPWCLYWCDVRAVIQIGGWGQQNITTCFICSQVIQTQNTLFNQCSSNLILWYVKGVLMSKIMEPSHLPYVNNASTGKRPDILWPCRKYPYHPLDYLQARGKHD